MYAYLLVEVSRANRRQDRVRNAAPSLPAKEPRNHGGQTR
jgi:hypothetical protein